MASTPSEASSIDSGYVTGSANEDICDNPGRAPGSRKQGQQSAESTKYIAPWIHPIIEGLCKELGAPAATLHILAGVTTILTLPSPPLSNDGENQKEDEKDKIPALIAAVYFFVRTRLSGRDTSGEEYVSQRKVVLSTLAKLRENEEMIEWEGWEKVGPKDVDAWLLETYKRGWLKLDWFEKIVEGAGLGAPAQSDSSDTQPNKSCLKRKPDAAESPSCQKKRKVNKDPRSDCLIPSANPISSIQPSASPELPSTPQNPTLCVSPLLIPSLTQSEETLTDTDGESPTVSITFDESTIESSTVTSPNITDEEAAQYYDIDLSENADYSKDRDFLEGEPWDVLALEPWALEPCEPNFPTTPNEFWPEFGNDREPCELFDIPALDDFLVLGADAMPSIQPSASPELPSTPRDIQNPPLCVSPPLPLSEETPNGELPTVSITSGQTTIESSSVTSAVLAVAPHDIVKPWESTILCGSYVSVSVSSLLPIEVRADRNHVDQIVSEYTDFEGRLEDSSPTMFMNSCRRPPGKSTLTEQQKNQKRKRATQNQLLTLEVEFNKNPTPTATVRKRIAEDINMTERSVQIWFQNRRAKIKLLAKKIETREDIDNIAIQQYLVMRFMEFGKGLGLIHCTVLP